MMFTTTKPSVRNNMTIATRAFRSRRSEGLQASMIVIFAQRLQIQEMCRPYGARKKI
jgi:hypothetical protein